MPRGMNRRDSEIADELRLCVRRTLKQIIERKTHPGHDDDNERNWLQESRQAILDQNPFSYRETLSGLVRVVLAELRPVLVRTLHLARVEPDGRHEPARPHLVLLSFHVSSVQLRKWFRVLEPRTAWRLTDHRGSEITFFDQIYDWDARYGHILTDPEMPEALDATFGATAADFSQWKQNTIEYAFRIKGSVRRTGVWDMANDLVASRIFTELVEHALDKCEKAVQVRRTISSLPHHFTSAEIADFAGKLEYLGNAIAGLWPKRCKPTMAVRARSFLLSFFYTIGRSRRVKCERIIAASVMPPCSKSNGTRLVKTGSLAVVLAGEDAREVQKIPLSYRDIEPAAKELAQAIVELEHRTLFEQMHDGRVSITEEDAIRQACEVDSVTHAQRSPRAAVPGYDQLLRLTRPVHEAIAEGLIQARHRDRDEASGEVSDARSTPSGHPVDLPPELRLDKTIKKLLLVDCDLVGTSRQYCQLIRDIAAAAHTDDFSETRVVFLDSEPGCGKEALAKLLHLFSMRGHLDAHASRQVSVPGEDDKALREVLRKRLHATLGLRGATLLRHQICQDHSRRSLGEVVEAIARTPKCRKYRESRLFNYFTLNMAALTDDPRFFNELFGRYDGTVAQFAGRCLLAHALGGTVFLDELNTLPMKQHANTFLRLLEKPFEMEIPGRSAGPLRGINMLTVFASNKSREELIEAGFNEAVVYRVTKTRIRVPPLRERPADIAVFVNSRVRKHNERRCQAGRPIEQVRRIDIKAMRVLCELRWPDNYRGVQGLVDDVLGHRVQRGVQHQELTFDEILHGLRRREAFQAAVSRGQTEAASHGPAK